MRQGFPVEIGTMAHWAADVLRCDISSVCYVHCKHCQSTTQPTTKSDIPKHSWRVGHYSRYSDSIGKLAHTLWNLEKNEDGDVLERRAARREPPRPLRYGMQITAVEIPVCKFDWLAEDHISNQTLWVEILLYSWREPDRDRLLKE